MSERFRVLKVLGPSFLLAGALLVIVQTVGHSLPPCDSVVADCYYFGPNDPNPYPGYCCFPTGGRVRTVYATSGQTADRIPGPVQCGHLTYIDVDEYDVKTCGAFVNGYDNCGGSVPSSDCEPTEIP